MANKIEFRIPYGEKIRFTSPTGNGIEKTYGYKVNSRGQKELVETGERNIYEEIQSYKEDCLIENILKRVAIGDMSDFRPDGIYQDISEIPTNLIDAKKEMVKVENIWNGLSNEQKAKYDFSLESFIADTGSEAWLINMGFMQPEEAPKIEPEKTTVEVPEENK